MYKFNQVRVDQSTLLTVRHMNLQCTETYAPTHTTRVATCQQRTFFTKQEGTYTSSREWAFVKEVLFPDTPLAIDLVLDTLDEPILRGVKLGEATVR